MTEKDIDRKEACMEGAAKGQTDRLSSDDEEMVAAFFASRSVSEIPDDGFSDRVMRQLPSSRTVVENRVWTAVCSVAAAVLLFVYISRGTLENCLGSIFSTVGASFKALDLGYVQPYFIAGALLTFALVAIYDMITRISSEDF